MSGIDVLGMVLAANVPDDASDRAKFVLLNRLPNYCFECGSEVVVAGGYDERVTGIYDHIDPVIMCSDCGRRWRHGNAFDQSEGQEYYEANLTEEEADDIFGGFVPYCNVHKEEMKPTKSMFISPDGSTPKPARQWKCPECDQLATVLYSGEVPNGED